MTKYTMENGLLVPSRRGFMQVLAGAFTGAVVAPMIVPAANLMHIDSDLNKLVVGYVSRDRVGIQQGYHLSLLNHNALLDPQKYEAWKEYCGYNEYSLVRRAEIIGDRYKAWPDRDGFTLRQHAEERLESALARYRISRGIIT